MAGADSLFGIGDNERRFAEQHGRVLSQGHQSGAVGGGVGRGPDLRFGDSQDADLLESLPLEQAAWIISTLPDLHSNRQLLRALAHRQLAGEVAVVARDDLQGAALKRAGAPVVLYPMRNAVDYVAEQIRQWLLDPARVPPAAR